MLWQDYLARQQLPPQQTQHYPQRRPADDVAQHRVLVKNTTEEEIPQFACMRVTGVSLVGDRTVIEVEKPSSTDGEFLFNCEYAIPVEDTEADPPQYGVGWAYRYGIVRAIREEPEDPDNPPTVEPNSLWGPIVDSWAIAPDGNLFTVFGADDRNENGLIGRFAGSKIRAVILDEELAAGTFLAPTSGLSTVCTWYGTAYTQTTERLTVYNHSTTNAAAVDTPGAAIWIDGHWWFFADCGAIASRPTPPWDV
jgi:hypothetical protein